MLKIDPSLADENESARHKVTLAGGWIRVVRDDRRSSAAVKRHAVLALEMIGLLYRAPHRYCREVTLAGVAEALGGDPTDRAWMRAARMLEGHDLIDLFERKGAGRATTLQIRNPPPYPMG